MTVPLGHIFFLQAQGQSTWPVYILCLTPAAALTSPEQGDLWPKADFFCTQNSGKHFRRAVSGGPGQCTSRSSHHEQG